MNKVIIIGCPGSGKSTFSKLLYQKTKLPLFHLDMLFWNADKTHISQEEFDEKLEEILEKDCFIIDGNYSRTMERRIKGCDTIFLFDIPINECIDGVKSRIGKPRSDMPWIEENFDPVFKRWILEFADKELPCIYTLLKKYKDKKIIIFNSRYEAKEYLKYCSF